MAYVTAVHFYVTDLDQAIDFYSRLLGHGPQAAYDEGESAHSAFFVLEERTYLVLTWDPERGREVGGSAGSSSPLTTSSARSASFEGAGSRADSWPARGSAPTCTTWRIPTAT